MNHNYKLSVYKIEDIDGAKKYENLLKHKWDDNVYYSIAHMEYFLEASHELMYFLFEKEQNVKVLMPFILRKIDIKNRSTTYFDVISPYGYSGPLFCDEIEESEIELFWKNVDQWYKKNNIVAEFIRFSLNDNQKQYSGTLIESLINIKGNLLDNFEDQWTSFLPKVRNNYRKAVKFDLEFKVFEQDDLSLDIIDVFYTIYTKTMNRNNAESLYFFSKSYFEKLIASNKTNFSIAVVFYKNTPISVELNIHYKKIMYAFLGGTDSDYFNQRPNDFLRVKLIDWAIKKEKKYYILGGGIKNGDGLYKSKRAFFPKNKEYIFYTGRKIIDKKKYETFSLSVDSNYLEIKNTAFTDVFFPYYRINN